MEKEWKVGGWIVGVLVVIFVIVSLLLPPPRPAGAFSFTVDGTEMAVNGGFETGDLSGWQPFGAVGVSTLAPAEGTYSARIGAGALWQMVPLPTAHAGTMTLSFQYKIQGAGYSFLVLEDGTYLQLFGFFGPAGPASWETFSHDISVLVPSGDDFVIFGVGGDDMWIDATPAPATSTVPEPCTMALVLLGGGLLVIRRRR